MQLCLFSGRFVGAFVLVASLAFTHPAFSLSPISNRVQGYLKKGCYSSEVKYHIEKGIIGTIHSSYATLDSGKYGRPSKWKYMKELKKVYASCDNIQKKINEFFHMAIKANEKRCQKEGWPCTLWHQRHQELYETALKNDDTILQVMIEKNSTYVRQNQKTIMAEIATKKQKAKEAAKKNAAEEAAKKKAAEEKAAEKQAAIDDAFSVFDITAEEAAAKIKAAEEKAPAKNTKVVDSYILTSKSLMEMYQNGNKELYKLQGNINAVEIKQPIGETQIKTITLDGQSKTISCGDTCTLYSAKKNSLQVGSDLGIPAYIHKAIMDAIVEAMGEEFVKNLSETELRKFQVAMRKLIVPHWKSLEDVVAKVMGDPNFNIASFMTKEQIKQIKIIQMQIRKSSQKNKGSGQESSGGSAASAPAEDHHEEGHHHHEEAHHEEAY